MIISYDSGYEGILQTLSNTLLTSIISFIKYLLNIYYITGLVFNAAYKNMSNAQFRHKEAYILLKEMCSIILIVIIVIDSMLTGNQA